MLQTNSEDTLVYCYYEALKLALDVLEKMDMHVEVPSVPSIL